MAKGQMRSNREKKKPKQDKDKKKGPSAYAAAYHAQPGGQQSSRKTSRLVSVCRRGQAAAPAYTARGSGKSSRS